MATFTVELYKVAEMRGTIGLDDYPIFDEAYRAGLNKKIFEHYMDHEIGMESVPRFLAAMRRRMNEIMPLFNQQYESTKLTIDPLNTMSLKTVVQGLSEQSSTASGTSKSDTKVDGTSTSGTDSSGAGQTVQSNFPQSQLQARKDYATAGSDTTNKATQVTQNAESSTQGTTGSESSKQDGTTTDNTTSESTGWTGSQAALLMQYRATFMNIDMDVINSLPDLFMFVWNNSDSYTQRGNGSIYA